ncbi:hypothetical protein ABPG73_015921 [Tetrahymena malaccensis]
MQENQNTQQKQLQAEKKDNHDVDSSSDDRDKDENKNKSDVLIPQLNPKFYEKLVNQKIPQIQYKKDVKQTVQQQSNQPLTGEISVKNQDNIVDFTYCHKTSNFDNSSYNQQVTTPFRLEFQQLNSQQQKDDSKEKQILKTACSPIQQKIKLKVDSPNTKLLEQNENLNEQIQSQLIDSNFKILNEKKCSQKLKNKIFKTKICKRRKYLLSQGLNLETINKIEQQIDDTQDFFNFYKDFLFLKRAIMILLSKEQLAAIKLVGIDIEDLEPKNHKVQKVEQGILNSHIKEQFEIMQSPELQIQYIKLFSKRCSNKSNLDLIDQRILSSLIVNLES